jgi:hypothetical protein
MIRFTDWALIAASALASAIESITDTRHLTTDPACVRYRAPRQPSRLDRAARGRSCSPCMMRRAFEPDDDSCTSRLSTRMVLCPACGNKRCPRATDTSLACTGSNEPNQPGSAFTRAGLSPELIELFSLPSDLLWLECSVSLAREDDERGFHRTNTTVSGRVLGIHPYLGPTAHNLTSTKIDRTVHGDWVMNTSPRS